MRCITSSDPIRHHKGTLLRRHVGGHLGGLRNLTRIRIRKGIPRALPLTTPEEILGEAADQEVEHEDPAVSSLSDEILACVFSFLEIPQMAVAACVCRSWWRVSKLGFVSHLLPSGNPRCLPARQRLDLREFPRIKANPFLGVLRGNPGLELLDMRGGISLLKDPSVLRACWEMQSLHSLKVWGQETNEKGPHEVRCWFGNASKGRWPSLRNLFITNWKFGIIMGQPSIALPGLRELHIDNCCTFIPYISCASLIRLTFSNCKIYYLQLATPELKVLEFLSCERLYRDVILAAVASCPLLRNLHLIRSPGLRHSIVDELVSGSPGSPCLEVRFVEA